MSRKSPKSVTLDSHIRCLKIYPNEKSTKKIDELQTITVILNKEQAIDLARIILGVSRDWDLIELTGYRFKHKRKSDNTYLLTITGFPPEDKRINSKDIEELSTLL